MAATAVVVVAGIYVVFWPVSDLIARHDAGAITGPHRAADLQAARDAARGRLLTFGAGLFAAGALVYTARNFSLSREGQVTDRYTKAIEQLGSKELDVRLGGIYALERVARDSARDHPTVMEVLAAFVRERSHEQWRPRTNREPGAQTPERGLRPDVQAAVTVIGRRNPRHDRSDRQINLTDANLAHADLIDANLTDAFLIGANLSGAKLIVADLTGALLHDADLTDANLHYTDLTHAFVRGADFAGADLTGVRWPLDEVVPDGWVRDTGSGRLKRTDTNPGGAPTDPAPAARRRDSTRRRQRVLGALDQLAADGQEISVSAVARAAGVDRSFLYRHHDLRAQIHARAVTLAPSPASTAASRQSLLADLANLKEQNLRLRRHNANLTARLSEVLGEEVFHASGMGRTDDTEQLRARLGELEQQILDLRQELEERADELDASRAANRDLMTLANRIPPSA